MPCKDEYVECVFFSRVAARVVFRDEDGKVAGDLLLKDRTAVKDLTFRGNLFIRSLDEQRL